MKPIREMARSLHKMIDLADVAMNMKLEGATDKEIYHIGRLYSKAIIRHNNIEKHNVKGARRK
jgi:hypothetical protein